MTGWETRPITTEWDQYASIAGEALQYYDASIWETYVERVGSENFRGVWKGEYLGGGLAFYDCNQWYGGKGIRCAAVSGVAIEPASRGSGACKTLLVDFLQELFDREIPLASLYASTQRLYRSVGFEQSGQRSVYSVPMHSLTCQESARDVLVTRTLEPDYDQLGKLALARCRRTNGNLERTKGLWDRVIAPIGHTTSTYLFGPIDSPEGFVTLHHGKRADGYPQALTASDWVANTPRALCRMMALVRDHRSMCDRFQWPGGLQDPLLLATEEQNVSVVDQLRTLNRIISVERALTQRGYPKHLECDIHFELSDPLIEENNGNWLLSIKGGHGSTSRGGDGSIKLGTQQLVPLFSGHMTCTQLIALGWAHSTDASQVEFTDAAFTGPSPWTSELF